MKNSSSIFINSVVCLPRVFNIGLYNNCLLYTSDDILKDSQGFLWIATRGEGIARYDGYEFTAFNMEMCIRDRNIPYPPIRNIIGDSH